MTFSAQFHGLGDAAQARRKCIMPHLFHCGLGSLVLLLLAGMPSLAQPTSVLAERGEELLSRECAMCHAVGQRRAGTQHTAPSFAEIAGRGDLARIRRILESGISAGHPAMPTIRLNANDIEAVLAYLATIGP
jgi:mono/diheme cytochrome c family protein